MRDGEDFLQLRDTRFSFSDGEVFHANLASLERWKDSNSRLALSTVSSLSNISSNLPFRIAQYASPSAAPAAWFYFLAGA